MLLNGHYIPQVFVMTFIDGIPHPMQPDGATDDLDSLSLRRDDCFYIVLL